MLLRFAYSWTFFITIPCLVCIILYRLLRYKSPTYTFPLAPFLAKNNAVVGRYHRYMPTILRGLTLCLLVLLIARPQWVDEESRVHVEGVDIILALDISGSMELIDDLQDKRKRFEVAQQEAIRFIRKRTNDPIGIVAFALGAISRCPLTLDKNILEESVASMKIGDLNHTATWLGTGLATAINRLKNSQARSKIIIALTDGQPHNDETIKPETAIALAQEFGIKIYTIGIGSEQGYLLYPGIGLQPILDTTFNIALLEKIASATGGKSFEARKPAELRTIYDTIDALEKTDYEVDLFHRYYEAFFTFAWILLALLGSEVCLRLFVWKGIQ